EAPQDVVGGDQSNQQRECAPDPGRRCRPAGQHVDQVFHAILGRDRAGDSRAHRCDDDAVTDRVLPDIAKNKCKWSVDVAAEVVHRGPFPTFCNTFDRAQPHPTRKHIAAVPVPAGLLTVARKRTIPAGSAEPRKKIAWLVRSMWRNLKRSQMKGAWGALNPDKEALNAHRAN